MAITDKDNAFVDATAISIGLSQLFTITAGSSDPAYVVLTVLDRDEYTAGATGATGTLSGNGHTLGLASIGGDARSTGIVFTYQASSGLYYNSTYGYLNQLTYNASSSAADVASLSLFGTSSLALANADAANAYSMMEADPTGYLGSATVVTQAKFSGTVPVQATPDSIAAVADSFVGDAWNMNGCWTLASTIATEAGASLPVQSTLIDIAGQANGEWIVAFNGPAGQTGNWQAMVTAGEIIVIEGAGGGHITTCVSGSGSTAMLVDNVTYENSSGQIVNLANDGSSSDVTVSAPHLASAEWAGVSASSVVIYELDTPVVSDKVTSESIADRTSISLASLFTATDPASKSITAYEVYDTAAGDMLVVGSTDYADHSATAYLTTSSLSSVSLLAGSTATSDTLEVRAYNGTYWGDWTALTVTVTGAVAPVTPKPPVLASPTPAQTWKAGTAITLALPPGTFTDPQNQALSYTATLSNGAALPSWLKFNAATDTFTGTAPATAQTISIVVKATDTSNLSTTETFTATILGAPVLTASTPHQTWTEGKAVSLTLASNTFTDPQGEALTYTATQSNGQALPSWLIFNATDQTFTGTAPATAETLGLTVTATDTSGLSSAETFTATIQAPAAATRPAITVTDQTKTQIWTDGAAENFVLPSNTFTDALGLQMTFTAYQVSGTNATTWLRFNPATDDLYGTVPKTATGTIQLEIVATDTDHVSAADLFSITLAPTGAITLSASSTGAASLSATSYDPPPTTNLIALHS